MNAVDEHTCSALLHAARLGHTESVLALLEVAGADEVATKEGAKVELSKEGALKGRAVEPVAAAAGEPPAEAPAEVPAEAPAGMQAEGGAVGRVGSAGDASASGTRKSGRFGPSGSTRLDVNAADMSGYTALMHAANNGDVVMATALLGAEGCDVNAIGDEKGWTALMAAAFHGQTQIAKMLLGVDGVDANAMNEDGWSALMWASLHGHLGIMAALLAVKGVDVNGAAHAAAQGGVMAQHMGATQAKAEEIAALLASAVAASENGGAVEEKAAAKRKAKRKANNKGKAKAKAKATPGKAIRAKSTRKPGGTNRAS